MGKAGSETCLSKKKLTILVDCQLHGNQQHDMAANWSNAVWGYLERNGDFSVPCPWQNKPGGLSLSLAATAEEDSIWGAVKTR